MPKRRPSSLYIWEVIDSFKHEICSIDYVPQLYWNWEVYKISCFLEWFWIMFEIGTFYKYPFWCHMKFSTCLYAWGVLGVIHYQIYAIGYIPKLSFRWRAYNSLFFLITWNYMWDWNFTHFFLPACIHRKAQIVSKMKFLRFDMLLY